MPIQEMSFLGPHGDVPLRCYIPEDEVRRGMLWLHGGGFLAGDLEMPESDAVSRSLIEAGILVVAVDYRLAPVPAGHPRPVKEREGRSGFRYPVASQEVAAVFQWAVSAFENVPGGQWALGGASAGANLAGGAAMRLRDDGDVQPDALLLAYPVAHAELPPLSEDLAEAVSDLPAESRFTPERVRAMNLNYVGSERYLSEPYAFMGGHDLTGLPPTFILNSDADDLRASGQRLGAELAEAGVDVLVIRENGTRHGHLNQPDTAEHKLSIRRMISWLLTPELRGATV